MSGIGSSLSKSLKFEALSSPLRVQNATDTRLIERRVLIIISFLLSHYGSNKPTEPITHSYLQPYQKLEKSDRVLAR